MRSLIPSKIGADGVLMGSDWCESSLIDLLDEHDFVDRFRLDHPGREMWTWFGDSLSGHIRSYLDRVLEEQTVTSLLVPRSTE